MKRTKKAKNTTKKTKNTTKKIITIRINGEEEVADEEDSSV